MSKPKRHVVLGGKPHPINTAKQITALAGSGVIHPESHHLAGTESKSYHPRIVVGDAVWRTDFCRGALAGTA